ASCSSRQRFASGFLQTPSRPCIPCLAASTSPCRVCRGLSPLRGCALPGAPMKDLIVLAARKPSVTPEMIPVSAVDHELSRELRVRPCERPADVVRFDVAPAILDGEVDAGVHLYRPKAARDGGLLHRVEI